MTVSPVQHLDDHYGDVGFYLVKDDDEEEGSGMTERQADAFLQRLKPRSAATLGDAVKKAKPKA